MVTPKRPRVLYVDNDNDSREMVTEILGADGIVVSCSGGVAEALELANLQVFDAFLLDLWMKDGNGRELCFELRNLFPHIPVVFYTGAASEREISAGLASGASAYLVKPYSELIAPTILRLVSDNDLPEIGPEKPLQHNHQRV